MKSLSLRQAYVRQACLAFVAFFFVASLPLWHMASPAAQSDIYAHAELARSFASEGRWFAYSLYYPLVYLATDGGASETAIRIGSTLLLALFVALRAVGALLAARLFLRHWSLAWVVAIISTLAMPLPSSRVWYDVYLGQLSGVVWHNSTVIMSSVFAIPAFVAIQKIAQASQPSRRLIAVAALMLGLATLSKPNFTLVVLPALLAYLIARSIQAKRIDRGAWISSLVAATPASLVLVAQFAFTFAYPSKTYPTARMVLAPLEVWNAFSSNVPLSLMASLLPAIVATVVLVKNTSHHPSLWFAWLLVAFAALQYGLLSEVGPDGHPVFMGNWTWGAIPAMACLTFAVSTGLASLYERGRRGTAIIGSVLLFAQVIVGLVYAFSIGPGGIPTWS